MDIGRRLVARVHDAIAVTPGIDAGLVVAVSGGPDSVALLRAIVEVARAAPIVAHLNHQLRGDESDADEAFVADLAAHLHVPFVTARQEVAAVARAEGSNLEEVARRIRYRWLAEVARSHRVAWVATGHTANDQAETVLHRLLRGTGVQGLRGIAVRRELEPGVGVVRPLLLATRADVLAYLNALEQPYRVDRSNEDLGRTRNRIRRELLPHLAERYNPGIVDALARLAEQASEVYRDEEAAAGELLREAERPRAGSMIVLDRQPLTAAARRLVRAALRLLWQREGWPQSAMDHDAWQRLAGVALGELTSVDLPGGVRARCRERVVQLEKLS